MRTGAQAGPGRRRRRAAVWLVAAAAGAAAAFAREPLRVAAAWTRRSLGRGVSLAGRLAEIGPAAEARLRIAFAAAGVAYPPARVALLGFKQERELHVYASAEAGPWRRVRVYPVLAASGGPGPKLREGDRQVPEGFYRVESLNPNSLYHVSLRLDYPNAFDRARAAEDGRAQLGGDIMIHGRAASIGCLAVGDPAAEDLFVLAAAAGCDRVEVLLAPVDLRRHAAPAPGLPPWTAGLYADLRKALAAFPLPDPVPAGGKAR